MEREIVIALANSPGVLDFCIWIAWRTWVLKSGNIRLPLFSPGGLKEQLGCQVHAEGRFLRRKINQWLRVIRAHWPQCPAEISTDGQTLIISSSKPSPALHPVQIPSSRLTPSRDRLQRAEDAEEKVTCQQISFGERLSFSSHVNAQLSEIERTDGH
jgi:hypothetical protein